jgi:hypothetical protein
MLRQTTFGLAVALAMTVTPAYAQQTGAPSDSDYIAKIRTSAPAAVVAGATIVQMQPGGPMRTVQTGSNGFTCMMLDPATPMCADQNAMAWAHAYMTHATPPDSVGFVYMLAGDGGASATDPYARVQTPGNHWVKTGPHVMIVGSAASSMGYPATADPDPTKPYVMWSGTPYAHLMIPVSSQP